MALPDIPGFTAIGSAVAMYDYTDGQPGDLCFPAGVPRAGGMMCPTFVGHDRSRSGRKTLLVDETVAIGGRPDGSGCCLPSSCRRVDRSVQPASPCTLAGWFGSTVGGMP